MDEQTRQALSNRASWIKGATLLLFFLLLLVATPMLIVVSLFGWIGLLVKGQVPSGIRDFGQDLARWYAQTTRYLTGNANRRPFPFEDLDCPSDEPSATPSATRRPAASSKESSAAGASKAETPTSIGKQEAVGKKAGKKAAKKKAGKKKTGKKKAAKKKAGKKKAGKKKSAVKEAENKSPSTDSTRDADEGGRDD